MSAASPSPTQANDVLSLARSYVYEDGVSAEDLALALSGADPEVVYLALEYLDGHGEPDPRPPYFPYLPHPGPQSALLLHDGLECLYGGAVGGGKSVGLLMAALQYVHVPGYSALLIRRTFKQLAKPGALIPLSHEWLRHTDAHWDGNNKQWRFPAGSIVEFGHLEHVGDELNYQGAAYQYVAFDELAQFPDAAPYLYLFSRLRKPDGMPVPLRMRASANPDGPGLAWVKGRFIDNASPPDRVFIRSTLEDNPSLDIHAYDAPLSELSEAKRLRLRHGRWDVEEEGPLWSAEHFPTYTPLPIADLKALVKGRVFTTWDLKGKISTSKKVRQGESYVSGCAWIASEGRLYLIAEEHGPWGLDDTLRAFYRLWAATGATAHYIEDKALGPEVMRRLKAGTDGPVVPGVVAHGPKGTKADRAEGIQPNILAGDVHVPDPNQSPWVSDWLSEIARTPAPPNDRGDTLVMAVEQALRGASTAPTAKEVQGTLARLKAAERFRHRR